MKIKKWLLAVGTALLAFGAAVLLPGALEKPRVALTFDDGPSSRFTPLLLDELKKREVCASFFLIGKNIEGNEKLVKRMQEEGHLIGSHTYSHIRLDQISREEAKKEILKAGNVIYQAAGVYPSYIRPPFGAWRKDLELSVSMLPAFWDLDTLDWKLQDADVVVKKVESQVRDGSIILMHDGYAASVEAAVRIVDLLKKRGYEFVTVEELLVT
ncbi:MAG: polysaccharide deacetylase family protein [Eubacteriales bacterium]|nr:polysaccharide deacetylase family protein [Eubacteriales bacterium]